MKRIGAHSYSAAERTTAAEGNSAGRPFSVGNPLTGAGGRLLYFLPLILTFIFLWSAPSLSAQTEEEERPAYVRIVSREQIMSSGARSLVAVLEEVAGVTFHSKGGPERARIDMRGFGQKSVGRVLVMVDGRRLNTHDGGGMQWLSIPLESIERIELTGGGASARYGNNAVAGVVHIITRDSEGEAEFSSTIDFGSHYSDNLSNGIFSDQRIRFGASQGPTDGAITFTHSTAEGFRDRSAVRSVNTHADGGWDATDIIRGELDLIYNWTDYEMPGGLAEIQYEENPSASSFDENEAEEHRLATLFGLEWYPFYDTEIRLDAGYTYQATLTDIESDSNYRSRSYHGFEVSPEFVLLGESGPLPWRLSTGADISLSNSETVQFSDSSRDTKECSADFGFDHYGAYLEPRIELSRELIFDGAIRFEQAMLEAKKPEADIEDSDIHHAFVYEGTLTYRPSEEVSLYTRGGSLFRYPFADEQATVSEGLGDFNGGLDPETGYHAEIGGSLSVSNGIDLAAEGYVLEMRDEIAWNSDGDAHVNVDGSRRWGAALEANAVLHRRAELRASYGYVYSSFIDGPHKGELIPLVPQHSLDTAIDLSPLNSLIISPAFSLRSGTFKAGDEENEDGRTDAYYLVDLSLIYRPELGAGNMELRFEIENLLDSLYTTYAEVDPTGGTLYYPAPGRSIRLLVSYSY